MPDLIIDVSGNADESPWDSDVLMQSNFGTTKITSGRIVQDANTNNMCTPAGHRFAPSRFIEITSKPGATYLDWIHWQRRMLWYLEYTDSRNYVHVATLDNGNNARRFSIRTVTDGAESDALVDSGNISDAALAGLVTMRFEAVEVSPGHTKFNIYLNGVLREASTFPAVAITLTGQPAVAFRHGNSGSLNPSRVVFGGYASEGHPFIKRLTKDLTQYQQAVGIKLANTTETLTAVSLDGEACTIDSQVLGEEVVIAHPPGNLLPNPIKSKVARGSVTLEVSGPTQTASAVFSYTKTHLVELPAPADDFHANSVFGPDLSFDGAWANFPKYAYSVLTGEEVPILFKDGVAGWSELTQSQLKGDINEYLWLPHGVTGGFGIAFELLLPSGEVLPAAHVVEVL